MRDLLTSPREHGLGVLGNALYWAGDILCLWAAMQLVDAHSSPCRQLVLGYSGGYVLTRRALPAGGAGFVEIALTLALVGMGLHFTPRPARRRRLPALQLLAADHPGARVHARGARSPRALRAELTESTCFCLGRRGRRLMLLPRPGARA